MLQHGDGGAQRVRIRNTLPPCSVWGTTSLPTPWRDHERQGILTTLLLASSFAAAAPASAEPPPLISRDVLFGNPERTSPRLSPDGKRLAWIAPDKKNVLQVWVKTIGKNDDKVVTADKKRGIRSYLWAEDDQHAALHAGHRRRRELARLRRRSR